MTLTLSRKDFRLTDDGDDDRHGKSHNDGGGGDELVEVIQSE